MKFKVLPEPPHDIAAVTSIHRGVPLVPDSEVSCCARLLQRTDIARQDDAKEWLTFLRALELVEKEAGQYQRRQTPVDAATLQEPFLDNIYLAAEALAVVEAAETPLPATDVFTRLSDSLPTWDQHRYHDPESVWRDRVRRILEWEVILGLLDRTADGYQPSASDPETP